MSNKAVIENYTKDIVNYVKKAQKEEVYFEEIFSNPTAAVGRNEFLFFIKPEITLKSDSIKLEKILDLIQDKIDSFGLTIHNVKILSAKYLDEFNIIAQHYGVINKISGNAVENMSETAKEEFERFYHKPINEFKVLGGSEFLNQYKNFTAYTLDIFWQNKENKKLSGGTYCEDIKLDNEVVHLINGFHPRQLEHFTESGRSIVVMTLSGNIDWKVARSKFIGATNPTKAETGSLRREFLDRKEELGLSEVSQGVNGVHLSAGPVEALIELKRYNSNFSDKSKVKEYSDFSFGKKLQETFPKDSFEKIISNADLTVNGKQVSVFDLTEEKNAEEAISLLKSQL